MKAAEGEASVAVVADGRPDIGAIEDEVERVVRRARITRPVARFVAGDSQRAIVDSNDGSATDKEPLIH